jgi:hypothetical protein
MNQVLALQMLEGTGTSAIPSCTTSFGSCCSGGSGAIEITAA